MSTGNIFGRIVFCVAALAIAPGETSLAAPPTEAKPAAAKRAKASAPAAAKPVQRRPAAHGVEAIEALLRKPTTMEFIDTPLKDVCEYLCDYHPVDIVLDRKALDDAGVAADTPITMNVRDLPLDSSLNVLLAPLSLTWTIHNDVLWITTSEAASNLLISQRYNVEDLAEYRDKGGVWEDYDSLTEAITSSISPASWDSVGGPSSVSIQRLGAARVLFVTAPYRIQWEVARLLDDVRCIAKQSGKAQPSERERPQPDASKSGHDAKEVCVGAAKP
jgi:hypothetical protein